jgi:hypothetical protein
MSRRKKKRRAKMNKLTIEFPNEELLDNFFVPGFVGGLLFMAYGFVVVGKEKDYINQKWTDRKNHV